MTDFGTAKLVLRQAFYLVTMRSRRDERGAIAVIAALVMPMMLAAAALSFDIGRVVDTNRSLQALADAVTLDAANFLDGTAPSSADQGAAQLGGPFAGVTTYALDQVVQYEGSESAMRNGLNLASPDAAKDSLVIGSCTAGSSSMCQTFTELETCALTTTLPAPGSPGSCSPVTGVNPATIANAVEMQTSGVTGFVFEVGSASSNRSATAMRVPISQLCTGSTCSQLCSGTTCSPQCTGTTCCPPGTTTCCPTGTTCCPPGQTCCTGTCCPPGQTCCTTPTCNTNYTGVSNFSIGSGLLEERTSGLALPGTPKFIARQYLVQLLSQELHASSTSISALSFDGLANSSITLGDLLAANSSAGTLTNLLDSTVTPGQAISYLYNALSYMGISVDASSANELSQELGVNGLQAAGIGASGGLQLCQLFDVAQPGNATTNGCGIPSGQQPQYATAQIDALDYLVGVANLINGKNVLSVNLGGTVPTDVGNLVANVTVSAISPVGLSPTGPPSPDGTTASCPSPAYVPTSTTASYKCPVTAQDTQAVVSVNIPNLPGGVTLNVQATGAQATGTLNSLVCGTAGALDTLTIGGNTTAATFTSTFQVPSQPVPTTLPTVTVPTVTVPLVPSTTTTTTKPLVTVPGLPTTTTTIPAPISTLLPTTTSTLVPALPTTTLPTVYTPGVSYSGTATVAGTTIDDTFTGGFVPDTSPAPQTTDSNVLPGIQLALPGPLASIPGMSDALNYINSQLSMLLDSTSLSLGSATVTDQSDDCSVPVLVSH